MRNSIAKIGGALITLAFATQSQATVTMTLANATTYAENSGSFNAYVNGNQIINGSDLIGIYSFNINNNGGLSISTPFYTTCLSPAGLLDGNTHTYDLETFADANPGINPNKWASSGTAFWGIQNANYLFSTLSGSIINNTLVQAGSSADKGAALALAMYASLYNSTGYGLLGGSAFSLTGLTGAVQTDYVADLAYLDAFKGVDPNTLPTGYVLRPDPNVPGSAQDMILLGSGVPQTVVPEPTTCVAAALLLLPFGASTARILRKNRASSIVA